MARRQTTASGLLLLAAACGITLPPAAAKLDPSRSPPMGWRSWNCFLDEIDHDRIIGQVKALATGPLLKAGYGRVGIDGGWVCVNDAKRASKCTCGGVGGSYHDAAGQPVVGRGRFPNLTELTAASHALGAERTANTHACMCSLRSANRPASLPVWPAFQTRAARLTLLAIRLRGWCGLPRSAGVKLDFYGNSCNCVAEEQKSWKHTGGNPLNDVAALHSYGMDGIKVGAASDRPNVIELQGRSIALGCKRTDFRGCDSSRSLCFVAQVDGCGPAHNISLWVDALASLPGPREMLLENCGDNHAVSAPQQASEPVQTRCLALCNSCSA